MLIQNLYKTWITINFCWENMLGVPLPYGVEVVGLKPCIISDILHILKELEYLPPLISNPKAYYIFY